MLRHSSEPLATDPRSDGGKSGGRRERARDRGQERGRENKNREDGPGARAPRDADARTPQGARLFAGGALPAAQLFFGPEGGPTKRSGTRKKKGEERIGKEPKGGGSKWEISYGTDLPPN